MDEKIRGFHIEEYKQLRAEVTAHVSRVELLFRSSIVVVAATFAWLLAKSFSTTSAGICVSMPKPLVALAWLIPPVFVLCAAQMARILGQRVSEIGEYLLELEIALGSGHLGWERFFAKKAGSLTATLTNLWIVLLALTTAASIVGWATLWQTATTDLPGQFRARDF